MNKIDEFNERNRDMVSKMAKDRELDAVSKDWFIKSSRYEYSYHFTWMGRPIIQFPQDIIAVQEIIWRVNPDLIIETGIAHGGSLIFSASMLELIGNDGIVVGVDIDIRSHNRKAIEEHPMFKRINLLEGSSVSQPIVDEVKRIAEGRKNVLVLLDSNHTHEHVLEELNLYAPLVSVGSYCVVFDTVIEDMPEDSFLDRPWGKGDNPKTAVWEFLKTTDEFEMDKAIEDKLLITVAPDGFLRRVNAAG